MDNSPDIPEYAQHLPYDPQVVRLPHPQRFMAHMAREAETLGLKLQGRPIYEHILGRHEYALALAELARNPANWSAAYHLSLRSEALNEFFHSLHGTRGATHAGNVWWWMDFTRWLHGGKHQFQTTDVLDRMLVETDIGAEIPARFLRSPYPICYIQFGETLSSPLTVWNAATQNHIAEGCYVLAGVFPAGTGPMPEAPDCGGQRFLDFVFTGSPQGKAHNLDDATQAITLVIPDEEATAVSVIEAMFAAEAKAGRPRNEQEMASIRACFFHVAKILLYLASEAVERAPVRQASELEARLARLKPGKRAKLERQLVRAYDRIVIGPRHAAAPKDAVPSEGGAHRATHWRRGHFRTQRYGEKWSLSRLIWIEPLLVNPEAATTVVDGKPYVVKETR